MTMHSAVCSWLTSVYIYNTENVLLAADGTCPFGKMEYGSVLYVPESMKSVYEGTSYVGVFSQIVGMDAETVGLSNIGADNAQPVDYYDMDGRKYDVPQRGVNVVRYSDGTVRKVMVK
ncbi:MAG: hypothetical protein J6C86_02280 [Bacteroidaceae bacterium]|nr:hypothetical protein [Bacteroidaceae bacterium]